MITRPTHYVVFPSADMDRGLECARKWMAKGYEALVGIDESNGIIQPGSLLNAGKKFGLEHQPWWATVKAPFPGYYQVIGTLVGQAFSMGAVLITAIGDDMEPPEQGADEHSRLYFARFPRGEGVMQCTGDRQGDVIDGKVNSERICGSPTFGLAWYWNAYPGYLGFPPGYKSFFADEQLKLDAERRGLLYQEPALAIMHHHWSWGHMKRQPYHLAANKNWGADEATFRRWQAENPA